MSIQRLAWSRLDIHVNATHCQGLHSVREVAGILSGDVSPQNILWTDSGFQDGRPAHFVLHDFDLPVALQDDVLDRGSAMNPMPNRRTGMLPFMAIDLLYDMAKNPSSPQTAHQLHHDYESLFWVAVWSTMKTEDKIEQEMKTQIKDTLAGWETGDYRSMTGPKIDIVRCGDELDQLPLTPRFEHLSPLLLVLSSVFMTANFGLNKAKMRAMASRSAQPSAAAVLEEWINRAKIKDALSQARDIMAKWEDAA